MAVFARFGRGLLGDSHEAGVILDSGPVEEGTAGHRQAGVVVLVGVDQGSEKMKMKLRYCILISLGWGTLMPMNWNQKKGSSASSERSISHFKSVS